MPKRADNTNLAKSLVRLMKEPSMRSSANSVKDSISLKMKMHRDSVTRFKVTACTRKEVSNTPATKLRANLKDFVTQATSGITRLLRPISRMRSIN